MSKPFQRQGSPYWHYDFQINGTRLRGSTGQLSRKAAQDHIDRLRREQATDPGKPVVTLNDAFGLYWMNVASSQPSARTTRSQAKAILRALGVSTALSDVSTKVLIGYASERRKSVSVATANREVQLFRRVHRYAHAAGYKTGEVSWGSAIGREPTERVRELSASEQERLFRALRADLHPPVRFALTTGARLHGVVTLRWRDVDEASGVLRFRAKGGADHVIPITREVQSILDSAPRVSEYVFTAIRQSSRGAMRAGSRQALTVKTLKLPFVAALEEAGVQNFRFHDLRHTAATRILRVTGNLRITQKLLGHTNISTTARYAHTTVDDLREAMEKL